jgi:hypothetical protein
MLTGSGPDPEGQLETQAAPCPVKAKRGRRAGDSCQG